jgi:hypothetical protein
MKVKYLGKTGSGNMGTFISQYNSDKKFIIFFKIWDNARCSNQHHPVDQSSGQRNSGANVAKLFFQLSLMLSQNH